MPGSLTPLQQERLVRLSTWMPFAQATKELAWLTGIEIHPDTARTLTEQAGAAAVAVLTDEVARLEQTTPESPAAPDSVLIRADGAMVPLVGGLWAETKTMVITTEHHSFFSRLTDHETFTHEALAEVHRRGVGHATMVAAVTDGAEWLQGFLDVHAPESVRILDFPHAAEYVHAIGTATNQDEPTIRQWLHALKHQGALSLMPTLRDLVATHSDEATLGSDLQYLEKRMGMMDYPGFHLLGLPIGSGAVESANKVVVEARLKGSGMHWKREHVNPMLALRNAVCNDRWDEVWKQIVTEHQQQSWRRRMERVHQRQADRESQGETPSGPLDSPTPEAPTSPDAVPAATPVAPVEASPSPRQPAADHPWKKAWSRRRQQELANAA